MLQQHLVPHALLAPPGKPSDPLIERTVGIADIWAGIRRHRLLIALCCAASIATGALYVYTATPAYVAKTQIYIQPAPRPSPAAQTIVGLIQLDNAQLESQIQILKSDRIARSVIRAMNLVEAPELRPERSYLGESAKAARSFLNTTGPTGQAEETASPADPNAARTAAESIVIREFKDRLGAFRVGQSYVLEVSFWAHDPVLAAQVANAVTASYVRDQIQERLEAANRGGEILEGRIDTLRRDVEAVDQAIRTGIIDVRSFPSADGRVISSAWLPLEKSWPRTSLILALSGFIGLLIGGAAATIRTASDDRLRSVHQIEGSLQTPVLGTLRHVRIGSTARALSYVATKPLAPFSRDVRQIKTDIEIAMQDSGIRCIGFTSALPREGKSVVASNIAYAFAAAGRRTLLIDCDVYSQTLSSLLGVATPISIPDSSSGRIDGNRATTLSNNLALLPLTHPASDLEPSALLGSPQMRTLLDRFRTQFDVVLLDLPAMTTAPDARAVSPLLDAIVVVAKFDSTTSAALVEMVQRLNRPAAKVIGVILNMYKR